MKPNNLEHFLEDSNKLYFYNLLGGLADNLLTIGPFAGTFVTCNACGDTFTLKKNGWSCQKCGHEFELKFDPPTKAQSPFKTTVRVSGLDKPRCNPHWYFDDENWTVAEFTTHILRLPAETFLADWLNHLGAKVAIPAHLQTILCWPRFLFGNKKKTIQPDFAAGFEKDFVIFDHKRLPRGIVAPKSVMGLIAFAVQAAKILDRDWKFVIVPGHDSAAKKTAADYVQEGLKVVEEARAHWLIPDETIASVMAMSVDQLAAHVKVMGWESLVNHTREIILKKVPTTWTRDNILANLHYFQSERAKMGLMDAVSA